MLILEALKDIMGNYPNIPEKDFMSYVRLDPTYRTGSDAAGKYTRWILTLANKNKLTNVGHVTDILTRFNDNYNNLKNHDIMKFKSIEELEDYLNDDDSYTELSHRQEVRKNQKNRKKADLNDEADLVYEDSTWEVWVPKTYAASCKLGQDAKWCTASTESDYYYNYYKKTFGGDYYIIINKHNNEEKYQFHFESNQFMDIDDYSIDLNDFLDSNSGLKDFFEPLLIKRLNEFKKDLGITNLEDSSYTIKLDKDDLAGYLSNRCNINRNALQQLFDEDIYEWFIDIGSSIDIYGFAEISDQNLTTIKNIYVKNNPDTTIEELNALNSAKLFDLVSVEDGISDALDIAYSNGLSAGAEEEALKDFQEAIYDMFSSIKADVNFNWGGDSLLITVSEENFNKYVNSLENLSEYFDGYSRAAEVFVDSLPFNFSEPYYGWSGFSIEVFNDRLNDELYDLEQN